MHLSVLPQETIELLAPAPGGFFVDGTLGAGGHTELLARAVGPNGTVLAFDRDLTALDATEKRLRNVMETDSQFGCVRFAHANYADLPEALEMLGFLPNQPPVLDGILLDIGLSSDQLADRSRGFSFESDGLLDLRFDTSEGKPAHELLSFWSEEHIANVIYEYGEERFSRRIAREIVNLRREQKPIRFANELAELVRKVVPKERRTGRDGRGNKSVSIDPATRTFQALRIAANDELGSLKSILANASRLLKPGGRIAVICFHSLEDRIVKNVFRDDSNLEIITKKPVLATDEEIQLNPRSRSAKLRVAAKIAS